MIKPGSRAKMHIEPCGQYDAEVPAWLVYMPNGDILPMHGTVRQLSEKIAELTLYDA